MEKTREQKGITLVALIITIVVLLILAVVTINAIKGDGIIQYAGNASDKYTEKANQEQEDLNNLSGQIEESLAEGSSAITLAEARTAAMLDKESNSTTYDIYGNKIVVPAGFKILVDSTTVYTVNDISVTKGVVIQDKDGNEFVWVPVGTIKHLDEDGKETTTPITLGRYSSFVKNDAGEYVPAQTAENYATKTIISPNYIENTEAKNYLGHDKAIAKDIGAFCTNSIANCGYYIGRFEAGDLESTKANTARTGGTSDKNTLVCKANQRVYSYVTQPQASSLSQNMYKDATTFTSDLINSYAWDTAIIFIQTFGGRPSYYSDIFCTSLANTGVNNDKCCNIYDMSGNVRELSTEAFSDEDMWVSRGGYYTSNFGYTHLCTKLRSYEGAGNKSYESFRPLLYL